MQSVGELEISQHLENANMGYYVAEVCLGSHSVRVR